MKYIQIYLKVTETCNLDCAHCFTNGINGAKIWVDEVAVINWFKRLKKAFPDSSLNISFHGGEPFYGPRAFEKITTIRNELDGLWDNMFWGATTNLVYNLKDHVKQFMVDRLDGLGTSWDRGIRFANTKQEDLWFKNTTELSKLKELTLFISLSRSILEMNQRELLKFVETTGIKWLDIERITVNGNARKNLAIIPSNLEMDGWFIKLFNIMIEMKTWERYENTFINSILNKYLNGQLTGNFCRDCEQKIFTLNADGTIGGCPNSAPEDFYGHIDQDIFDLVWTPKRQHIIACETARNTACYTCDVNHICGGDCHQLLWEDGVCASPKSLMRHLQKENNRELYREILSHSSFSSTS